MNFTFWRKKTVIEILKNHLILMNDKEKVEHLKAIIPEVCEGIHVAYNPKRKEAVKPCEN